MNAPAPAPTTPPISERLVILLVGAVQFVNVLDFMMVMPLGPDFARALGIPTSHIGLIGGSYTAAAALAGVLGSLFLDRFDRRVALGCAMVGLVVGTALGGFATGLGTLLGARILAGAFGGPATSLSLAIVADTVPPERRGKALGWVMAAFSLASVLGVPAGLELGRTLGWRAPFFAVAGLGVLVTAVAVFLMPPLRSHLGRARAKRNESTPLFDSLSLLSLTNTALVMLGVFSIVPNISAYVQYNLGYPREQLGTFYLVGGIASFLVMRLIGVAVDRFGSTPLVIVGTLIHLAALVLGFLYVKPWIPVLVVFTLFMVSGSVRMVPLQALSTRVPRLEHRAAFMSAQSAVQHAASATGAVLASLVLVAPPTGPLQNIERVAWGAAAVASLVPFFAAAIERRLKARDLPVPAQAVRATEAV
ncbi:MAG TPA: MFS transporter [Polyangiaceae bacterium]|nr:MFS transporter [Polyangiaceae bacterium]